MDDSYGFALYISQLFSHLCVWFGFVLHSCYFTCEFGLALYFSLALWFGVVPSIAVNSHIGLVWCCSLLNDRYAVTRLLL